jgi:hypothetical protein
MDAAIDGKPSLTLWEATHVTPSATWGEITTVSLWPKTGRTHQLRKHMAHGLGRAILGDPVYRAKVAVAVAAAPANDGRAANADDARAGGAGSGRTRIGQGSSRGPGEAPAVSGSGDVVQASDEHGTTARRHKGDALSDGTRAGLCLWAVELRLPHPMTREPLLVQLPEPAVFGAIRRAEAAAARA